MRKLGVFGSALILLLSVWIGALAPSRAQFTGVFNPMLLGKGCTPLGVQTNLGSNTAGASTTQVQIPITAAIPAGAMPYVTIGILGNTVVTVSGASDTAGGAYNAGTQLQDTTDGYTLALFYRPNHPGLASGSNITVAYNSIAGGGRVAQAGYVTGLNLSSPLDQVAIQPVTNPGVAPTTSAPSATTPGLSQSTEFVVMSSWQFNAGASVATAGSGYSIDNGGTLGDGSVDRFVTMHKSVASNAAVTEGGMSWSLSKQTMTLINTFKGSCP